MSYLNKRTLPQQQEELKELIEQRLNNEDVKIRQRVYQWLSDNQYFVDNELFDFYFCVAQNIAAVEELGGSGEKIVRAKMELEQSAQVYATQFIKTATQMTKQLENQLSVMEKKQDKLEWKLIEVLERLTIEHQNLQTISTGLVNSTTALLKQQKQLVIQTEAAKNNSFNSVILAWTIPVTALLAVIVLIFSGKL
ncbi:MAG: hypothetical protein WBM44_14785 [Waterburya sp.]